MTNIKKLDFDEIKKVFNNFWNNECDKPLIGICYPKGNDKPVPRPHPYYLPFGNIDTMIEDTITWVDSLEYLGASFPMYSITFTPDHFSAFLGCNIEQGDESSYVTWVTHPFKDKDLDDIEIVFNRDSYWWQKTIECIHKFREKCDGKILITGPHIQGGLDCLAALKGVTEILMDVAMYPEKVKNALQRVNKAIAEVRNALADECGSDIHGYANRFNLHCKEYIDAPQCDISAMISPEMFEEIAIPALTEEMNLLAASVYHLDGPDAIKHVESLCRIKGLDMIQWIAGEGVSQDIDWTDLYLKIDSLGKGLYLRGLSLEKLKKILPHLTSKKIFIHYSWNSFVTEKEALNFIEELIKII